MALKVTAHNIPAATVGLILIKQKTQIKNNNHTLLLSGFNKKQKKFNSYSERLCCFI